MKRGVLYFILFLLAALAVSAQPLVDLDQEVDDLYEDIGEVEILADPGLTPDDFFYFLDVLAERLSVGDNPEKALRYKEEKILEAQQMIKAGKVEEAKEALARAGIYGDILAKEVSPEIERRARESSKAVLEVFEALEADLGGQEWEDVRNLVAEHGEREEKIAQAAILAAKINALCNELAELDPLQYAKACKTDDDSPLWQRDLDKALTKAQREEAEQFFTTISACFENPRECPCEEFSIKSFAEACEEIAPLAAACDLDDDEEACDKLDELPDPIDLLPPHLQDAMAAVEERFRESEFDHHMPRECIKAGALTRQSCMRVMFKIHAPPECQKALEEGKIDPTDEREAREACEKIMFSAEAPQECLEAGITDHQECGIFMFKLDAPQECVDAGLTGEGRNDWRECDKIRFTLEAPPECLDAGITGDERDAWKECEVIRWEFDAPQVCLDAGIDPRERGAWDKCNALDFQQNSPQECLDAGLDGTGRDDWRKCEKIRFELDAPEYCLTDEIKNSRDPWRACDPLRFEHEAPQACLDAGIDPNDRRAWEKCERINFETSSPQECLDAGLTGRSPRDWQECDKIRFRLEAPQECLDAGLTGDGRNDWERCNKITGLDVYEERHDDYEEPYYDDSPPQDYYNECTDGCHDECPGAYKTQCVNDRCECYYDNPEPEPVPEPSPEPEPTPEDPEPEPVPEPTPEDPEPAPEAPPVEEEPVESDDTFDTITGNAIYPLSNPWGSIIPSFKQWFN